MQAGATPQAAQPAANPPVEAPTKEAPPTDPKKDDEDGKKKENPFAKKSSGMSQQEASGAADAGRAWANRGRLDSPDFSGRNSDWIEMFWYGADQAGKPGWAAGPD
jgi:hypothetical protein